MPSPQLASVSRLVLASAAMASSVACGARASSLTEAVDPCSGELGCDDTPIETETQQEDPQTELPKTFSVLEVRLLGTDLAPPPPYTACDPYEYEARAKVNFEQGLLIWGSCKQEDDGTSSAASSTHQLLASDLALIQSAYELLQPSRADQCTSGAELITLDLSTDQRPDPEVLLADDDHSGCALPHLEGHSYVSGLDELLTLLQSLHERDR